MCLERPPVLRALHTGSQFLGDYDTDVFEWGEQAVELPECFVRGRLTEALYEEVRIEKVFARRTRHRSGSGDAI